MFTEPTRIWHGCQLTGDARGRNGTGTLVSTQVPGGCMPIGKTRSAVVVAAWPMLWSGATATRRLPVSSATSPRRSAVPRVARPAISLNHSTSVRLRFSRAPRASRRAVHIEAYVKRLLMLHSCCKSLRSCCKQLQWVTDRRSEYMQHEMAG